MDDIIQDKLHYVPCEAAFRLVIYLEEIRQCFRKRLL